MRSDDNGLTWKQVTMNEFDTVKRLGKNEFLYYKAHYFSKQVYGSLGTYLYQNNIKLSINTQSLNLVDSSWTCSFFN